jgi:sterol desaturase/sphingolipid hydroxylase (fatty acid hydroxylase superfamily)
MKPPSLQRLSSPKVRVSNNVSTSSWRWLDTAISFYGEGLGGTVHGSFFFSACHRPMDSKTTSPVNPEAPSSRRLIANDDDVKDQLKPNDIVNNSSKTNSSFPHPPSSSSSSSSDVCSLSKAESPLENIHQCTVASLLRNYITLTFFMYTPNLIWFLLALAVWVVVPYRLSSSYSDGQNKHDNDDSISRLFLQRLVVNVIMVGMYYGFWHVALYLWHWGKQPFLSQRRVYRTTKVIHNMWYTMLGTLQWTLTETAILYITYIKPRYYLIQQQQQLEPNVCSDHHHASNNNMLLLSSSHYVDMMLLILFVLAVPIFRDVHFYVAHRFLHVRFLYKYLHALHHRNTDVEPFSGLSMHPTEHLYYFTCYGPWMLFMYCIHYKYALMRMATTSTSLLLPSHQCHHLSPPTFLAFGLFWTGVHVLLSPAASHSGFADHWQADLYHYLHHRYFDCNYASPALPFDKWMGTFRDRLVENVNDDPMDQKKDRTRDDPKASVMGWDGGGGPTREEVGFYGLGVLLPVTVLLYYWRRRDSHIVNHRCVAMILATFPLLAAAVLHGWSFRTTGKAHSTSSWSSLVWKHYMAPFHEDSYVSHFLHFVLGAFLFCILPLFCLLSALLEPP